MYYKKAFWDFIKILFGIMVFMISVIYISDPYMFFHKRLFHKDEIYADLRVQNYGLIKYLDFDNMILGSSMLENTSAYEANEKLGGTWVNLSYGGQRSFERFKTVNLAVKKHKIKNIITSLDISSFEPNKVEKNFEPDLYDENFFVKWKIYMNTNAMNCIFLGKYCNRKKLSMDHIAQRWMDDPQHYERFGGFDNWLKVANGVEMSIDLKRLLSRKSSCIASDTSYKQTIDNEILPLFENTDTVFHLIIPPYSALSLAYDDNGFDCKMAPYKYVIEQSRSYQNVRIYWLYDEDFVFDIANYKDLTHYTDKVNSLILDVVRDRSHIINVQNYESKIRRLRNKVKKVNVDYYVDKVKAHQNAYSRGDENDGK